MSNYDIFISYRRDGGADFARQMQLALSAKGYSVFLDFDALKDGVFDRRIESAIKSSKVFLFVLSPHSLDRCCNENDWVRREIECALISQCHIVPVNPNSLFQGFEDIEGLPYSVKNGLGQHQISTVMMNDLFECTFQEFVTNRIAGIVSPQGQTVKHDAANGSEIHIETDLPCCVMRFKEELIQAHPDDDNLIYLKKGSHKLKFVSLDNPADNYTLVYTVKDDCEILQVNLTDIRNSRIAKEEEAVRKAKEEEERKAMKEKERKEKERERRKAKVEAERKAKEEAERKAKEEAERREAKEKAERDKESADDKKYVKFSVKKGLLGLTKRYGFKKDGVIVIPAIYNYASDFSEGLALVRLNGKFGIVDKTGREIIPPKYDEVRYFSEGLAKVKLNDKYGFVDKTGKVVIPLKYEDAGSFSEGLALVRLNGKYGFVDKTGKEVIPLKYEYAYSFSEGLALVKLNDKYGFVDKTGKEVIPLKYKYANCFSEGLAGVKSFLFWGFIDKSGNVIVESKYDWVSPFFSEGLAIVELNGKRGFVDKTGKEVIPLKYESALHFIGGVANVELNGEWIKIDKQGNVVE